MHVGIANPRWRETFPAFPVHAQPAILRIWQDETHSFNNMKGHTGRKNRRFHGFGCDLSKITRPVAAIKSFRFALFRFKWIFSEWSFGIDQGGQSPLPPSRKRKCNSKLTKFPSLDFTSSALISQTVPLSWWRHQMETFSALLALCVRNSQVTGEFPSQRPVTRSFDVSFDLRLNKRLSKKSWGWWFETPSRPLWRHCNRNCCLVTLAPNHQQPPCWLVSDQRHHIIIIYIYIT